jgi:hypothetical protein
MHASLLKNAILFARMTKHAAAPNDLAIPIKHGNKIHTRKMHERKLKILLANMFAFRYLEGRR